MNEYDFLARIQILGEPNSGKTTLWYRYCEEIFLTYYYGGSDIAFRIKMFEVNGKKVKMQIWDTAGQERFRALSHSCYRGTHGFMLCYATNNRKSFERVEYWMEEIGKYAREDACIVLVGTKSDLSNERAVSIDEGVQKAELLGIKFFETSAKENLNIDEAFLELTRDISEVLSKKKNDPQEAAGAQLHPRKDNREVENNCFNCS